MSLIADILLPLFILTLGVAFGAGLYEAKMVVPMWFPRSTESGYQIDTQAMAQLDSGVKFWAWVTTGPLTLLTLANLTLAWQTQAPAHTWWLASALIILVERIGTFSFFIPTIIKLQRADKLGPTKVNRLAALWIGLNYVRNGLTLLAWILALIAYRSPDEFKHKHLPTSVQLPIPIDAPDANVRGDYRVDAVIGCHAALWNRS